MLHDTELIGTITAGLVVAFLGGFVATRLRLPAIVGYLVAGVAVGPFTPGYAADTELAPQIAEIGVILLMFGVGIHFSVRDLLSVRKIAIPGAVAQIAVATALAAIASMLWGWSFGEGVVLGLAISVASTVVLLRALEDRNSLTSREGRVAVGWLIVEDLFTVLALVFLPIMATTLGGSVPEDFSGGGGDNVTMDVGLAIGKVIVLTALMFAVGGRIVPWLLLQVARTGSRELFTLAVLAAALGIAFGSAVAFDVSLALGAFLAGLVVGQSDQSHQAAADALPLRDAFAVLFFVSVGMLFDPAIIIEEPLRLAAILGIIVLGKGGVALAIVLLLKYPLRTGLVVAAGLGQVGEFSFILADMGTELDLLSEDGNNLVLAAAIVSITMNPFLFRLIDPIEAWAEGRPRLDRIRNGRGQTPPARLEETLTEHVVLCGYGRIGRVVGRALDHHGLTYVVIEQDQILVEELCERGIYAMYGDAAHRAVLHAAHLESARAIVVATQDGNTNRRIVECAQRENPNLHIIVRTHDEAERAALREYGIRDIVMGDVEIALTTVRRVLPVLGIPDREGLETMRMIRREFEPEGEMALQRLWGGDRPGEDAHTRMF